MEQTKVAPAVLIAHIRELDQAGLSSRLDDLVKDIPPSIVVSSQPRKFR